MKEYIHRFLQHPLTRGMDVDDPYTTHMRRDIIRSKPFLTKLYQEWYNVIRQQIPNCGGQVVELGSGAGFMKECIPEVITTDVLNITGVDRQLSDSGELPFFDRSLSAIVMTDVLHHISTPRLFFTEAARVVKTGGSIIMIEPWVTPWSILVYKNLHSEPFRPEAAEWEFPSNGPLSGANGALPWIMFERDQVRFEKEFPEWKVTGIETMMPFTYLLSGGVSMRTLVPGCLYGLCRAVERGLGFLNAKIAMFALCTLVRQ
jgi:SAM-dependent methyltransferase